MPVRKSVIISELLAIGEGLIATGRYGKTSDVMRTALERGLDFQAYRDSKKPRPRPSLLKTAGA